MRSSYNFVYEGKASKLEPWGTLMCICNENEEDQQWRLKGVAHEAE